MDETQNVLKQILAHIQGAGNTGLDKLAPAYVAAWGEVGTGVSKNANNPHFGNDYADLAAHLELVKPVFARHGLAILHSAGKIIDGNLEMVTLLIHTSGQNLTFTTYMPLGGKSTSQSVGSAFTYGKRYQEGGLAGLASVDDDGEASSQPAPAKKKQAANDTPASQPAESYASQADALLKEIAAFTGTVAEFEEQIRPRVEDMADAKINKVYVERRREIKKGGK